MLYVIIGIGLVLTGMGFLLNENNAKYLLAGYNTMSEAERQQFNLTRFLAYFRKFHLYFGLSIILLGVALHLLVGGNVSGIFLVVYPIVGYIYFLATSRKYSGEISNKSNKIGITVLVVILIGIIGLFAWGLKENRLRIEKDAITIDGMYGETIPFSAIDHIELTDKIPSIRMRTNGFSLGNTKKGQYKTDRQEQLKLLLNSQEPPYLLIVKNDQKRLFYSSKTEEEQELYRAMQDALPREVFQ